MTDIEIPECICGYHGTEMEWVEDENHPNGGFWDCLECDAMEDLAFTAGGFETDQFGLEYEYGDSEDGSKLKTTPGEIWSADEIELFPEAQ